MVCGACCALLCIVVRCCVQVIVMQGGRVAESGRPADLLCEPDSMLTALAQESGEEDELMQSLDDRQWAGDDDDDGCEL